MLEEKLLKFKETMSEEGVEPSLCVQLTAGATKSTF